MRLVACGRRCPVGFAADSLMDWSHMMENQNDQVLVTRKTELTGAQKAGYLFAGLLGGAGCAILASLCNIDAPYRSDCTKFAHRPRHPNRAVGHRLHRDAALHGDALLGVCGHVPPIRHFG